MMDECRDSYRLTSCSGAEVSTVFRSEQELNVAATSLIESLLTISRADAGQIPLELTTFRLMDLAREGASLLSILSEDKNQEVIISGDANVELSADRLLVRQALANVLHNAVRHAPVGGRIVLLVSRIGTHFASLSVTASGPGIPQADCEKVFERFYRADNSRTIKSGGTGLGLPIARRVLEAHGGTLTLQSVEDVGCTVQLQLPLLDAS